MAKAWKRPPILYFSKVSFQKNTNFDCNYFDEGAVESQIQVHGENA